MRARRATRSRRSRASSTAPACRRRFGSPAAGTSRPRAASWPRSRQREPEVLLRPVTELDDVQTAAQAHALRDVTTLLDWRRRVFDLYRDVRSDPDPRHAWERWRAVRDELLAGHPQSPLAPGEQDSYPGAPYFDYDPRFRVAAKLV